VPTVTLAPIREDHGTVEHWDIEVLNDVGRLATEPIPIAPLIDGPNCILRRRNEGGPLVLAKANPTEMERSVRGLGQFLSDPTRKLNLVSAC
jgi:hypothetical protein